MPDPIFGDQHFVPNPLVDTQKTRFYRDPSSGSLSIQYTNDGGKTWKQFISQPSSLATEGWIPTLDLSGNVVWRPINSLISSSNVIRSTSSNESTGSTPSFADFYFPGTLFSGKTFGYYDVPAGQNLSCFGVQVTFFMGSAGGSTVIEIKEDLSNTILGQILVQEGKLFHYEIFNAEKIFSAGDQIRLKVLSVSETIPGEFMTCRLLLK